jgi:hypothetical protein
MRGLFKVFALSMYRTTWGSEAYIAIIEEWFRIKKKEQRANGNIKEKITKPQNISKLNSVSEVLERPRVTCAINLT